MIKLSPSILAADFANLERDIKKVEHSGAHYLHIDVMDGFFVPNISLGPPVIKSIRSKTDMVFDVHLMIDRPERYIKAFFEAGADIINVHVEATEDIKSTVRKIKELGAKAGVTIKPKTPVSDIFAVIDEVDLILVMSVEPGFGGQPIILETLDKVKELKRILGERNLKAEIEIDGGIELLNLEMVLEHGADVIVVGSSIFRSGNIEKAVLDFLEFFDEFEMKKLKNEEKR